MFRRSSAKTHEAIFAASVEPAEPVLPATKKDFYVAVAAYMFTAQMAAADNGADTTTAKASQYPKEVAWIGEMTLARSGLLKQQPGIADDEPMLQDLASHVTFSRLQQKGWELPPEEGWTVDILFPEAD